MKTVSIPMKAASTANVREHWAARHRRTKPQRRAAALLTKSLVRDLRPALTITLTRVSPRALDDDNLRGALKSFRDGVASALRIDDRSPLVRFEYAQRRGEPNEHAVDVTFTDNSAEPTP
jgi:glucose-6-phosphate-specific signal transduction histidine kinase